jgi:O-antigen biosynthesis protein
MQNNYINAVLKMTENMNNIKGRPAIDGKFLLADNTRFYIRGVTYGTFKPDRNGDQFPPVDIIEKDFKLMSENGINTVRTYTSPPIPLLDLAMKYELKVMAGQPWEQHITFLESEKKAREIISRVKESVLNCRQHPAILCYAIGNEIPAPIVRWYGEKKIANFLHNMYNAVKESDPEGLVTYINYPTTEYLDLPFLDFNCFNVFLENQETLSKYLMRLHNLTGDKPLVLAEIGLDSMRHGKDRQAELLRWQISTTFEKGCAGLFVFSWTDEWWRGGNDIGDWDFGIVDRERNPKPALLAVRDAYREVPFSTDRNWPRISIVVCSYNGARTIRDTMERIKQLDYPNYQVVVVNDGSKDATPEIVSGYDVKLISTENRGLSNARNTGLYAADGEIVAYLDDDAYPDPQWLKYLASAYMNSGHAGIGGPNISPTGDGPIADCVSNAPGGPVHVLSTDEVAEHIPGCNMSFRRSALMEVGGFDPLYRAAGDDVDVCWRIQEKGYTIGFHPSAFVWHHCRNSFKMYWKQQKGYGKAEALLEKKWPGKYNSFGHLNWTGHIYGIGLTKPLSFRRKKIFYGSQGLAPFQIAMERNAGLYKILPLMPEWYLLIMFFGFISVLGFEWRPLFWAIPAFCISLLILVVQAVRSANNAVFKDKPGTLSGKLKYYGLTAFMHLAQPIARLNGRIRYGLTPWRNGLIHLKHAGKLFTTGKILVHWSENWQSQENWLNDIKGGLERLNNRVMKGGDYDRWDLQNRIGPFASVRSLLTIEEHGQGKQYLKMKRRLIISWSGILIFGTLAVLSYFAFTHQAMLSCMTLLSFSLLMLLRIIADASYTLASLELVMQKTTDGIILKTGEDENSQSVFAVPENAVLLAGSEIEPALTSKGKITYVLRKNKKSGPFLKEKTVGLHEEPGREKRIA